MSYSTQEKIDILFENFRLFLKEKNVRYGDAATHPIQIFSRTDPEDQIKSRLDDKLNRIKNSAELKKNDLSDLFGYTALLLIQNNWLSFDEFLD